MAKIKVNQPSLFDFYDNYSEQGENYGTSTRNANETQLGANKEEPSIQRTSDRTATHAVSAEQNPLASNIDSKQVGAQLSQNNPQFDSGGANNSSKSPIPNGNGSIDTGMGAESGKSGGDTARDSKRSGGGFGLSHTKQSNIQQPTLFDLLEGGFGEQQAGGNTSGDVERNRNNQFRAIESQNNGLLRGQSNTGQPQTIDRGRGHETPRNMEQISQSAQSVENQRGQRESQNSMGNPPRADETIRKNQQSFELTPSVVPETIQTQGRGYTNFHATQEVVIGSLQDRFSKNLRAIQTLIELETNNRLPSEEESHILNSYSGWGGLPQVFDERNEKWRNEYEILKNTLSPKEYNAAKRSTLDAFYTPKIIVDTIYKGLEHFGFNNNELNNGKRDIFEPSVGIGTFLSYATNPQYSFSATELDNISSRIATKLYPAATIFNNAFEKHTFTRAYDAFIGNPPFGQKQILDKDKDLDGLSVHNYFIANAIKNLKDDGIAAFVVSSYFLDSKDSKVRELIAKEATLLGAIRLPNNAFKKRANTEVMSDIVFFKKGAETNIDNTQWIRAQALEDGIYCNEYFLKNHKNVIGTLTIKNSQYGKSLACECESNDIGAQLERCIESMPKNVFIYHETIYQHKFFKINRNAPQANEIDNYLSSKKVGHFVAIDGEIFNIVANSNEPKLKIIECSKKDKEKLQHFIALRDTFNTLIELEQSEVLDSDSNLISQRAKLNTAYNNFVKKFGYLNNRSNISVFKEDVELNKILALEKNYTKAISKESAKKQGVEPRAESAQKAIIFSTRTIKPSREIIIKTPKDALMASLALYGNINNEFLTQSLPQMEFEQIINNLKEQKLVFVNHNDKTEIILAENYLSGNVKKAYNEVKELVNNGDDSLAINLESLEQVLPRDLKATEIGVNLGTTWIPIKYYAEFIAETFGCDKDEIFVEFHDVSGWHISIPYNISQESHLKYAYSDARHSIDCEKMLQYAITGGATILKKQVGVDSNDKPIYECDQEATAIVNEKIESLRYAFNDWIYRDYDRRVHLEQIYNDTFNTNVEKTYDGSHLILQGFNNNIQLYQHQKNAIWRAIQEKNILFDHQVGAGKTLVAICSLMEQKRMGLIQKPLVIVPNHILKQWGEAFYNAYPNANILLAEKDDFEKNKREQFFARIAANNYDCVIMTHSQFMSLPLPKEYQIRFKEEEISNYRAVLSSIQTKGDSSDIKRIEKKLDSLEKDLEATLRENKTDSIDFSELGIDCLVVDEAHEFKNLGVTTSMKNVLGLGSQKSAKKAQNLYTMTSYLHDNDLKLYFLTGTPISNSIVELYTMQKYLQPHTLKEKGIISFDSWSSVFGETAVDFELDSSGVNYKLVTRFSKFKNVGELVGMYRDIADVISNEDILKVNPQFVPKLYNDKPINVVVPRSDEVAEFIGVQDEQMQWNQGSIVWRMEHFSDNPQRNNVLACTTDARKAGLDYRMIDSSAEDYEESKINAMCKNILMEYKEWDSHKGTQLIFCDLSTPKIHSQKINSVAEQDKASLSSTTFINLNETIENSKEIEDKEVKSLDMLIAEQCKFDAYSDILKKLVNLGIPQNEIAFIHDAKTDLQKQKLFDDVNAGRVRVLLGSRPKMGAGTNVQERITAVHHLDCPWRPSDLLQSNGRAIRQGNKLFAQYGDNFRIKEFRYATERTYDARQWQVIETKSRSIEQFRSADKNIREFEDISMGSADAAEMKAEATGNPLILLQIQLAKELKTEQIKESAFKKELFMNEETLKNNIATKPLWEQELATLKGFKAILDANTLQNFSCKSWNGEEFEDFTIHKKDDSAESKQKRLEELFWQNFDNALEKSGTEQIFFEYRGLTIKGIANDKTNFSFFLEDKQGNYIEPDNLIYTTKEGNVVANNLRSVVRFNGFWSRVNNFCNKINESIENKEKNLHKNAEIITTLSEKVQNNIYPRAEYLESLRKDNRLVIDEIQKMSKEKDYKSNFEPQSPKILAKIKNLEQQNDTGISR